MSDNQPGEHEHSAEIVQLLEAWRGGDRVDVARLRRAQKRGGGELRVTFTGELAAKSPNPVDVLTLNTALLRLQDLDPRQADVVDCRASVGSPIRRSARCSGSRPPPWTETCVTRAPG